MSCFAGLCQVIYQPATGSKVSFEPKFIIYRIMQLQYKNMPFKIWFTLINFFSSLYNLSSNVDEGANPFSKMVQGILTVVQTVLS